MSSHATSTRGAKRRRLSRRDREAQIIEIALRHFARAGYHGVSVDGVAEEAGITKPLVYAYFGSKEGLFIACAEQASAQLCERLEASAARHPTAEERMWSGCLEVFRFIEEHRESWRVLYLPESPGGPFGGPASGATDAMASLITTQFRETAAEEGIVPAAAEHLEPLAHAFVHATIGLGRWWMDHPDQPRELMALHLMNFAWMGFENLGRGRWWVPPPPGRMPKEDRS